MLLHPGKTIKNSGWENEFSLRLFFRFHCARGFIFLSLKFRAETSLFYCVALSQNGCRADRPAEGVRGARSPLLWSGRTGPFPFLKFHAEIVCLFTQPLRGLGPGSMALAWGYRRRGAPCSFVINFQTALWTGTCHRYRAAAPQCACPCFLFAGRRS